MRLKLISWIVALRIPVSLSHPVSLVLPVPPDRLPILRATRLAKQFRGQQVDQGVSDQKHQDVWSIEIYTISIIRLYQIVQGHYWVVKGVFLANQSTNFCPWLNPSMLTGRNRWLTSRGRDHVFLWKINKLSCRASVGVVCRFMYRRCSKYSTRCTLDFIQLLQALLSFQT